MARRGPTYSEQQAREAVEGSMSYAQALRSMATLDTHCGRNVRMIDDRVCEACGRSYRARHVEQRYCSLHCGIHHERPHLRVPRPETRKVPRPSYEQLKEDLARMNWVAVARKYGVSDNAVRKWMRWYVRDAEAA